MIFKSLMPAAITPVYFSDYFISCFSLSSDRFNLEKTLKKFFDAREIHTYTSLMRSVCACFIELKARAQNQGGCNVIILPRYCCPSFIHGSIAANLEIRFCDVIPETLSIDIVSLKEKISDDVLVILCPNLFGLSSDIEKIITLASDNKIFVVEGVDYGIGTIVSGRKLGTRADAAILNFQEGKLLPIGGGAFLTKKKCVLNYSTRKASFPFISLVRSFAFIVFSRPKAYYLLRTCLSLLRIDKRQVSMEDTMKKTSVEKDFDFNGKSLQISISRFQSRLGYLIFSRLEKDMCVRQKKFEKLTTVLSNIKGIYVILPELFVDSMHPVRLAILVDNGKRDGLINLLMSNGIEASSMYIESGMIVDKNKYPGAWLVSQNMMTIPCHPYLQNNDINKIKNIMKSYMEGSNVFEI